MNIIKPIIVKEGRRPTESKFARRVISKMELNYYLKASVPDNINKKMKATWEERYEHRDVRTSYENYTRSVCGDYHPPMDCWQAHEKKWVDFRSMIMNRDGFPYYSVHY